MAEVKVKEIQTLDYGRPAIQKGYANQTLHVDLAASQISIKPVSEQMKEIFVGERVLISGSSGMRSKATLDGVTRRTPSASPPVPWVGRPFIQGPAKAL